MSSTSVNHFTPLEERLHALTHGIGLLLSIAALALLVIFRLSEGDLRQIISAAIYGATLVLMYSASTLYHGLSSSRIKRLFQKFDHSAIYLLIAGSYTPVMLVTVGGVGGWVVFGIEWGIGLLGILFKFRYPGRFELFSLVAYLLMGWMIVAVFEAFRSQIDPVGFWLMVAGGAAYTGGVLFYILDRIRYFHAIWHLFVLAGSTLHFFAIFLYVV